MSLYHEAAEILNNARKSGGSLKSLVFGKKTWRSDAKALYALATETSKWSAVLSEVLERSLVLKVEKSLSPTLALLLVHDLFLSRKGIALPASHGLNSAINRHRVRLSAEITKARLRRGFGTLEELRKHIDAQANAGQQDKEYRESTARHPRWIRVNTLKATLDEELESGTFSNYAQVPTLDAIIHASAQTRAVHVDEHVPNLLAIASPDDPTTFQSYKSGKLILQEKASCFPAYLLDPRPGESKAIDGCAAPGNKTTHLAAILGNESGSRIMACEKDVERSKTLSKMVKLAGADHIVHVKQKQNFTRLDQFSSECADVTDLLLDPSCSGSGIFGRDEASITLHLPSTAEEAPKGKKRKRGGLQQQQKQPEATPIAMAEESVDAEEDTADAAKLQDRLQNLASFQVRIVEHAMSFPAAKRITYSTCSIHAQENENVVVKALLSDVAVEQGWGVLHREDQVQGMKRWKKRGNDGAVESAIENSDAEATRKNALNAKAIAEACIRCDKGGEDGTMGFFVVAFARDPANGGSAKAHRNATQPEYNAEEWNGFSGDEA